MLPTLTRLALHEDPLSIGAISDAERANAIEKVTNDGFTMRFLAPAFIERLCF